MIRAVAIGPKRIYTPRTYASRHDVSTLVDLIVYLPSIKILLNPIKDHLFQTSYLGLKKNLRILSILTETYYSYTKEERTAVGHRLGSQTVVLTQYTRAQQQREKEAELASSESPREERPG